MKRPFPVNEAEFQGLMEEIDSSLRAEGVPISYREMRGLSEVSRRRAALHGNWIVFRGRRTRRSLD